MNKRISQTNVYLIYSGATAFFFTLIFTINQVYYIDMIKLNPLQLVLVGTVLELSAFLFEIPTGIVADMKSRKMSVIIGTTIMGLAFLLEGLVPMFIAVIISQVLWGLGYTFTSGADEAWIADETGEEGLDTLYLRGAQIGQFLSFAGILISTIIGSYMVNLPIIAGGALFLLLAVFLLCFMTEENFSPAPQEERNSWRQMKHTFLQGIKFIKSNMLLKIIFFMSLLYGLYSEGFDRLWTAHFISDIGFWKSMDLKPVVWIGIIDGTAMILSILSVEYIKRVLKKTGKLQKVWLLTGVNLFMVAAIIVFAFAGNFSVALSSYLMFYILRRINDPIFSAWKNRNLKSEVRATVLSTYGQLDALGQIIGGPVIGFIALKASISVAIFISSIFLVPILGLYLLAIKKHRDM
ncbi:MFS transporter [Mobilitalea sibirica]|uniref:MFS transporter n=1 Tax=Mobilitalea sibirica TaxID=1462919 RepID=A0A8J7H258_9FIRM|nr:MFS transporter [Mobilitalea sibirica]MBH1940757.1 MFS transporter [Mobilitalea sibirica]